MSLADRDVPLTPIITSFFNLIAIKIYNHALCNVGVLFLRKKVQFVIFTTKKSPRLLHKIRVISLAFLILLLILLG